MTSTRHANGHLTVGSDEDGSRLDRFLLRRLGSGLRPLIMRLVRKGNVRVDGKRAKPETRLSAGQSVFVPASLRGDNQMSHGATEGMPGQLLDRAAALPVLFEDDALLAVDKPAGMVVHGGSGHGAGLVEALKQLRKLPDLRLAHRLDRDTSGVLLLAKTLPALRDLAEGFRERDMQKTYFALVAGHPYPYAGRMVSNLAKGVVIGGERMVVDDEEGKEAVTDYQVVMQFSRDGFDYALLALKPYSGRTHQLRVQLQQEGHAILGDNKYAQRNELVAYKALGGRGLMLHAWRLRLTHPVSGQHLEVTASWPHIWRKLLVDRE